MNRNTFATVEPVDWIGTSMDGILSMILAATGA